MQSFVLYNLFKVCSKMPKMAICFHALFLGARVNHMLVLVAHKGFRWWLRERPFMRRGFFQIPVPNRSERWRVTCVIKRGIYGCPTPPASACFPQMYPTESIYLDPIECSPGSYAALFVLKISQQANAIQFDWRNVWRLDNNKACTYSNCLFTRFNGCLKLVLILLLIPLV